MRGSCTSGRVCVDEVAKAFLDPYRTKWLLKVRPPCRTAMEMRFLMEVAEELYKYKLDPATMLTTSAFEVGPREGFRRLASVRTRDARLWMKFEVHKDKRKIEELDVEADGGVLQPMADHACPWHACRDSCAVAVW